ncbi:MAG: four helix bundle protein [Candidatus Marinimicrobia bacterium]|nr:four helix bundle protein [Candidatus Neomarinimicrobiota bacterium]
MNPEELSDRFLNFASSVLHLESGLNKSYASKHIYNQLVRSATSCGANYEEARSAESKADFIHKLQISLKELRESSFWLRLLLKTDYVTNEKLNPILNETNELISILVKSIKTLKKK